MDRVNSIIARIKAVHDLIEALTELNKSIHPPSLRQAISGFILADLLVLQEIAQFVDKHREELDRLLESIKTFIQNTDHISGDNEAAKTQLRNQVRNYINSLIESGDIGSSDIKPIEAVELDNMVNAYLGLISKDDDETRGPNAATRHNIDVDIAQDSGERTYIERNTANDQFDNDCDPNEIPYCNRNGHAELQQGQQQNIQQQQVVENQMAVEDRRDGEDRRADEGRQGDAAQPQAEPEQAVDEDLEDEEEVDDDDDDDDDDNDDEDIEIPDAPRMPVAEVPVMHQNDFDNALMHEIQNLMNEIINEDLGANNPGNN